ncbi:MAG: hypothetical protein ABI620_09055 [Chloroflexota bacterium]
MIGLLLMLYPARWRRRYGEEFRAILETRPLGPFDVADVLLGALDARLTRFRLAGASGPIGGHLVMLRTGGFGAIGGGILWFAGIFGLSTQGEPEALWLAMMLVGNAGLLLALAGLSAFQAYRNPKLTWAAFAIPAIGTLLSIAGLAAMALAPADSPIVAGWSAYGIWVLGLIGTVVGSILFGVATLRAAVFSSRAAAALIVSAAAVIALTFGLASGSTNTIQTIVVALGLGAFAASWVALGVTALRRGPIRAVVPAT